MAQVNMENRKAPCNFSIDHILNRAGENTCNSINTDRMDEGREQLRCDQYTFQWLNCTRYHPPKLPRLAKKEGVKRQPGRHPRIPFTPFQIEVLEDSYKRSPYLSPDEVARLSQTLELSDMRIKIWFQNRRAREKREKEAPVAVEDK